MSPPSTRAHIMYNPSAITASFMLVRYFLGILKTPVYRKVLLGVVFWLCVETFP